jgi:hypothetical protein
MGQSRLPRLEAQVTDSTMWSGLLHAGLAGSFLKVPHVPPDAAALREHGAGAAIYGIPFNATNISRTVVGVDVVEVAPTLDPTVATTLVGNRIAIEAMLFSAGCGR